MENKGFRNFLAIVIGTFTLSLMVAWLAKADGLNQQSVAPSVDERVFMGNNRQQVVYYNGGSVATPVSTVARQAGIQLVEPVSGDALTNTDVRVSVVPWVEGLQPSTTFTWELWLNGQRMQTISNRSSVVVAALPHGNHTFEVRLLSYHSINVENVSDSASVQIGTNFQNASYQPAPPINTHQPVYTNVNQPMCPYVTY